jgi:SAM-dependent methyltransferase
MSLSADLEGVRRYYAGRLASHGTTPRGADWNSAESQELRFRQLLKVCDGALPFRLGDYGCGYGALLDYTDRLGWTCSYSGYDIAPEMVAAARERHGQRPNRVFATEEAVLAGCDYVVASGIFNVKLAADPERWREYVLETVRRFAALAGRGFAFNALTSYSDPERMRPDLYYADPCLLFDYCKRHLSRHVALLHDYGLYEFTLLVRL